MRKGVDLVKKAVKDFELARKYRDAREYITASILYRKATEKVLRALYVHRKKQEAPRDATMEYLAKQSRVPDEVYYDLVDMPDEGMEMEAEESMLEYDDFEQTHRAETSEHQSTLAKQEVVRRLIDYAKANI